MGTELLCVGLSGFSGDLLPTSRLWKDLPSALRLLLSGHEWAPGRDSLTVRGWSCQDALPALAETLLSDGSPYSSGILSCSCFCSLLCK